MKLPHPWVLTPVSAPRPGSLWSLHLPGPSLSTQGPSYAGSGQGQHPTLPHSTDPVPRVASTRPTLPCPRWDTPVRDRPPTQS